jgi:hypothetical protein
VGLLSAANAEQHLEAVLADFEVQCAEFVEAVRRAPDAALRFKPAGEDYALGGLVVHVADVLRHYGAVLDAVRSANGQPTMAPAHDTTADEAALIRDGFGSQARAEQLERLREAHAVLAAAVRASGAEGFTGQVPVTYAGASEPHPTSPADVVGWVRDHYAEHTKHVADLVSDWASSTR